jgi:hypothetical protein
VNFRPFVKLSFYNFVQRKQLSMAYTLQHLLIKRHTHKASRAVNREKVMKRMHIRLILATIALLWMIPRGTTIAQQPPDNVQGDRTIYSTSIETGETVHSSA